ISEVTRATAAMTDRSTEPGSLSCARDCAGPSIQIGHQERRPEDAGSGSVEASSRATPESSEPVADVPGGPQQQIEVEARSPPRMATPSGLNSLPRPWSSREGSPWPARLT